MDCDQFNMVEVFNVKIQEIEGLETRNLETGLEEELQIVDHGSKILASIFFSTKTNIS